MAQAHVLPALLAGRTLMLGRALPRFHNVMSTPTVPASALETMASSQMVGVRVPVMAYSPFFKRVSISQKYLMTPRK